jgi:hypothetical protein
MPDNGLQLRVCEVVYDARWQHQSRAEDAQNPWFYVCAENDGLNLRLSDLLPNAPKRIKFTACPY